jgi:flagellar biosynthesis protein FlhF
MKLKTYVGKTEKEAYEKINAELGPDAVVLSIKRIQPRGVFKMMRHPYYELTAAYDGTPARNENIDVEVETKTETTEEAKTDVTANVKAVSYAPTKEDSQQAIIDELREKLRIAEDKLAITEKLLADAQRHSEKQNKSLSRIKEKAYERIYSNDVIQIFYESLLKHGVLPEIAQAVLNTANASVRSDETDINVIIQIVYSAIDQIITKDNDGFSMQQKKTKKEQPHVHIFVGPTGVGKTTSIAKLASIHVLKNHVRVGLITLDTYRIAAVEQLKTYADILGVDFCVAYDTNEIFDCLRKLKGYNDLLLIDTAGRSHQNEQNFTELSELINNVQQDIRRKCKVYLVVSLTTKYDDILTIVDAYSNISDFTLIFTKLDETEHLGSMLNICYVTNRRVAYLTNGQNVPDDIEVISTERIVKTLLGL